MIATYATAADFTTWETRAKDMTTDCLIYTVKDCHETAESMRGWNPIREGFYMDQMATYGDELRRRRANR